MGASFQSILSQIKGEWSSDDWKKLKTIAGLPNLLTVMHEAAHWMQRQTLLERALHLIIVRSLLEEGIKRTTQQQQDLIKVIICRQLLSPISEGLALYTQFDYFPANFYIGAGGRSSYDGFIEFLVARRDIENPSEEYLPEKAWAALSEARLSVEGLTKKRALLDTPFLILDDHVSGYLIIKSIICNVRCGDYPFYVHDGLVVPLVTSLFYNNPQIINAVLDSHISAADACKAIREAISQRIQFALSLGSDPWFLNQFRGQQNVDFEHSTALDQDRQDFEKARNLYSKSYDAMRSSVRTSLGNWIREDQSLDDYIEQTYRGKDGDAPYPLSTISLLSSPHFGRLFSERVRINVNASTYNVELSSTGGSIGHLSTNSIRAERYGWIVRPDSDTDGVLTEAIVHLHGLRHDFFSLSFISHERGLLELRHNTIDKNIGYPDLGRYLEDAYRIDRWLARIHNEFAQFESSSLVDHDAIERARVATYLSVVESVVDNLAPGGRAKLDPTTFLSGRDMFSSREAYDAYIAFSIAIRFGDFAFESSHDCRNYVAKTLSRFPEGYFSKETALRFIRQRGTACSVQKYHSSIQWSSFSCRL